MSYEGSTNHLPCEVTSAGKSVLIRVHPWFSFSGSKRRAGFGMNLFCRVRRFASAGCLVAIVLCASVGPSHAAVRPPWTSNRVIGSPNPPAPYTVERLFPKLTFDRPVDVATLPGTDRILVLEQGGKLLSFPNRSDVERTDFVFDFRRHHQPFDSSYAIAFHPQFSKNRYLFVCYA